MLPVKRLENILKRVAVTDFLTQCQQKKKWSIDKVRCAVEERVQYSYKSRYSAEVNVKSFSDDDS